jgi:pimeloyl-ACP methyl ester carboxylesterase
MYRYWPRSWSLHYRSRGPGRATARLIRRAFGSATPPRAPAGRWFKRLAVTPEELKKCDAPILFIHGENESDHVKNKIASARTALGRGEVRIIAGGDHMTTLGKPEFSAALIGFLRAARAK